jgi:SAM-dependent methyltransferase
MTCPICDGALRDRATVELSGCAIYQCRSCGSGILWPRPDQTALSATHDDAEYFNHPYFESRRDAEADNPTYDERLSRLTPLLANAAAARVLDLGCDTGTFMAYLSSRVGAQTVGVDVSRAAVTEGQAQGRDVRLGTLEAQRFPNGSFDALTAFDVVEHVADPRGLLVEAARILKPGAPFVAEVPHFNGLIYRMGRMLGSLGLLGGPLTAIRDRLFPVFHVQYPTVAALRRLLHDAGFSDIVMSGREFRARELALDSAILRPFVLTVFAISGWLGLPTVLVVSARAPRRTNA